MIEPRGIIHGVTCSPHFMAILDAALNVPDELRRTAPVFVGKATVTSDGFVMCDFIDNHGIYRHGAFVCGLSSLKANAKGLDEHIRQNLIADWGDHTQAAIARWIGKDWRH